MYEGGIKSGARRVMKLFFILCIIVLFYYFGKVVLSYIDSDGTVMGSGSCKNNEGFLILQKAGVFGDLHINCTDKDDEEEKKDESVDTADDGEDEEVETKKKNWRSKY